MIGYEPDYVGIYMTQKIWIIQRTCIVTLQKGIILCAVGINKEAFDRIRPDLKQANRERKIMAQLNAGTIANYLMEYQIKVDPT